MEANSKELAFETFFISIFITVFVQIGCATTLICFFSTPVVQRRGFLERRVEILTQAGDAKRCITQS